ncbi:MAG: alpha/beta hydrolase [Pseudomonadales bacterium]
MIEHFSKPGGENWTFDYREQLAAIACSTLITAGDIDPVTSIAAVEEMAAHIPDTVRQLEVFADRGYGVHRDDPRAFEVMKKFVAE